MLPQQLAETPITQNQYNDVILTDEETEKALLEARRKKFYEQKIKSYWTNIHTTKEWHGYNHDTLYQYLCSKMNRIIGKVPTPDSLQLINQLTYYLMGWESERFDNKKGLLVMGNTGTGKTILMQTITTSPLGKYEIVSCKDIADYAVNGKDSIERYYWGDSSGDGKCYDDLGVEKIVQEQYQKSQYEVMTDIIATRYDKVPHYLTRITTNLNAEQLEQRYGSRVRSRLREMCNIITLTGKDLRT